MNRKMRALFLTEEGEKWDSKKKNERHDCKRATFNTRLQVSITDPFAVLKP
jgi:hypothetical protein